MIIIDSIKSALKTFRDASNGQYVNMSEEIEAIRAEIFNETYSKANDRRNMSIDRRNIAMDFHKAKNT